MENKNYVDFISRYFRLTPWYSRDCFGIIRLTHGIRRVKIDDKILNLVIYIRNKETETKIPMKVQRLRMQAAFRSKLEAIYKLYENNGIESIQKYLYTDEALLELKKKVKKWEDNQETMRNCLRILKKKISRQLYQFMCYHIAKERKYGGVFPVNNKK